MLLAYGQVDLESAAAEPTSDH